MQVVVNSLLTHYERSGKGRSVVILHGWSDSSRGWESFRSRLAENFDVIVLDLPGFGKTEKPDGAWGLQSYAQFVADFLKKIKVKPYALIGHSNGGAIALRGLSSNSLKSDKLILLDSSGIRSEYAGRNKALRMVTKTGKLLAAPFPRAVKKRLRRRVYTSVGSDVLIAEHMQETFKNIVIDDVQPDAARLKMPTLILYGEDDLNTPPHFGRLFHNLIDGSKLEVINDAGHFVHRDKPEDVLDNVQKFLL